MQKRLEKSGLLSPCTDFPLWVPFISCSLTRAFFRFISDSKNTRLLCSLCLVELLMFAPSPLNKCASPDPRLYLLTATLSTRAASPLSTTKTCTTTRISGTCESVWPAQTVYTLRSALMSRSSSAILSIMQLTLLIVLVI